MTCVFMNYGIEVMTEDDKFYIRFDSGELASSYKIIEVSQCDAIRAQNSENDAYSIILKYQNAK